MRAREWLLYLLAALGILALAFLSLRLGWFDRETAPVLLPETTASPPDGEGASGTGSLVSVSVTPETVQAVIATLARPDSYSRHLRVESRWEGGSRAWLVDAWQKGSSGRIRLRPEDGKGPEKNILTRDGTLTVWYEDPEAAFRRASDALASTDALQMIPTYEDVLALEQEQIAAAGYVLRDGAWRIMAAAGEEPSGYLTVYYISIETGLLEAAERWDGETLIYSMTAQPPDLAAPEDEVFFLPGELSVPEEGTEDVTG
jgi:hypothetical protein